MEMHPIEELLMDPFGTTGGILDLLGRIKDQIEHEQQFMDLGEEFNSKAFSTQPNELPGQPEVHSSPFHRQQNPLAAPRHESGPDAKMSWEQAAQQLRQLGALVYLPDDEEQKALDWSDMGGYEVQKRTVEDLVLMSVKHADEYERVAKQTRKDGKHQRPKVRGSSATVAYVATLPCD
jgi:cell division protein FtsN